MILDDIKAGDKLIADDGFTCIAAGAVCVVEDGRDGLKVCCEDGTHYLAGQVNEAGEVVGFKRVMRGER